MILRILILLALVATTHATSVADESHAAIGFHRFETAPMSHGPRGLPAPSHKTHKPDAQLRPTTFQPVANPATRSGQATGSGNPMREQQAVAQPSVIQIKTVAPTLEPVPKPIEPTPSVIAPTSSSQSITAPAQETNQSAPKRAPKKASTLKLGATKAKTSKPLRYSDNPLEQAMNWRPSTDSLTTMGAGLGIVVGLLLCLSWVIQKSMPRSSRVLPGEVVEILGRMPLGRRQNAQLIKIGRKLVLVATTADGSTETLTEISSEHEVQQLLQLCEESQGKGSSAAFDEIFRQMSSEPTGPSFLGEDAPAYDPRQLAAAYANTPGGQGRG